jgi:hypothetical protein
MVQRIGDGQARVVYSVAGRSEGRMMLCVVCTVHEKMMSASFLIEPQNQGRQFISGLASKPLGRFVSGLASKPVTTISSGLTSKPMASGFLGWALK